MSGTMRGGTGARVCPGAHADVSWTALHVTPARDRAGVLTVLFDYGAQGVQEEGDALVTHFPPDADVAAVRRAVLSADPAAVITVGETPPVDWTGWRAGVGAHTVGRLTVSPPWLAEGRDPATTVVIDPAMAFGTGEHATTRGVLRLMQDVILEGDAVADLGSGSAVLSIAAAKLGAARVAAIESDPDAAANAEENIERNGVAPRVKFLVGDAGVLLPLVAPVRVVLANIVSSVLLDLLPGVARALAEGGVAILSGILCEEREMVLARLSSHGWVVQAEDVEDDWWSVRVARSAPMSATPA